EYEHTLAFDSDRKMAFRNSMEDAGHKFSSEFAREAKLEHPFHFALSTDLSHSLGDALTTLYSLLAFKLENRTR
ncbi:hypothetical protein, partial [Mesorhizobium sp.]|uniref:hypothetical protein n=1 Tax=Mesorhizobium sp. TaxID=1871066 RepID=UPI0025FEA8FD